MILSDAVHPACELYQGGNLKIEAMGIETINRLQFERATSYVHYISSSYYYY